MILPYLERSYQLIATSFVLDPYHLLEHVDVISVSGQVCMNKAQSVSCRGLVHPWE